MPIARWVVSLSIMFSFVGCAGIGVVDSPDPLVKLNDAAYLFEKENRPVPAQTLIVEATEIYQKRNDPHGLGNANREYGDFLRSAAVFNWRAAYSHGGFSDPSITYDNRLEKASVYYSKALAYYRLAETQELAAGKYDSLTNVYYNMALSNFALGAQKEACADYDRALQAYKDNMQRNPTAHPQGTQAGTVPESIAAAKKGADCK
jgi:tetratricopeptide (TPR) repeat protein